MGAELYRKDFPSAQAAHDALPDDGGTVFFESGVTYEKDGVFIDKNKVRFVCEGECHMYYPLDMPNSDGELMWADLVKSKGIFVTKGAAKTESGYYDDWSVAAHDFYCEGFLFENARIGSDYSGAGIRGQGKGLTVVRCGGLNCQNIILTGEQIDAQRRVFGYVRIEDLKGHGNGYGGYAHDAYIGPCARIIVKGPECNDEDLGHHVKLNLGGGVGIVIGGIFPNSSFHADVHCGVDATSGHAAIFNAYMRKPDSKNGTANVGKAFYMSNYREWSPVGCEYLAVNNHVVSLVQQGKGQFFWVDQQESMKDPDDVRQPPRINGVVARNLCRYLKNTAKPGYDYGVNPFKVPDGVTLSDNIVQTIDVPFEYAAIDFAGAPDLTEKSMIVFYEWVRDHLDLGEAQDAFEASVNRTIAALKTFEAYDPMEAGEDGGADDSVTEAQADLNQAHEALEEALSLVESAQAHLSTVSETDRREHHAISTAIRVLQHVNGRISA